MARNPAVLVSLLADWDNKKLLAAQKQIGQLPQIADKADKGFATSFKNIGASAIKLGAAFGIGFQGIQALGNVLRDSIAEANEAIKVNAATAQIIESTGRAANVTADQVAELSQKISEQIAVDDELIQQSANLILTFKNVKNEGTGLAAVFDRTVLAAQDLAAAGFGDAESAAKMLGKALNDPIRGLTALSRAGVTFSQTQKEQIQSLMQGGNVLAAQQLILKEVESQVGGVAAATATATARFTVMFDNLKEEIGLALMPLIEALVNGLLPVFTNLGTAIRGFSGFVKDNADALRVAALAVGTLTAVLIIQRSTLIANVAALGLYQASVLGLVKVIDAATASTGRLATAIRFLPWVAAISAAAGFVYYLEEGATAQEKFRRETEGARRSIDNLRDSTGRYTAEARYLLATNRYSHLAQTNLNSANKDGIYTAEEMADATNEQAVQIRNLALAMQDYIPWVRQATADNYSFTRSTGAVTDRYTAMAVALGKDIRFKGGTLDEWRRGLDETAKGAGKAKEEIDKLTEGQIAKRDYITEFARNAVTRFQEIRNGIADTLMGYLNIGNAAESYAARQKAVTDTLVALEDYRRNLTEEATEDQIRTLGELQSAHDKARESARTGAQGIVEEFVSQADKFREFGEKMLKLLRMGLNRTTLKQIMDRGFEIGSEIADAFFRGNTAQLIADTNKAVEDYNTVANEIAREAAMTFEAAGIRSAIAMARGFMLTLAKGSKARKEMRDLINELEAELSFIINGRVNVPTPSRPSGPAVSVPAAPSAPGGDGFFVTVGGGGIPVTQVQDMPDIDALRRNLDVMFGPYPFADGGLVTKPTIGLVGEAGPEVVIPLDRLSAGGGTMVNVTVNAGLGTHGAEVGRQIVEVLKAYEKRNGPIPVTVA